MTSKQVMWTLALSCIAALSGCAWNPWAQSDDSAALNSPYPKRQVWAVAPLRNESGSLHADGTKIADHLAEQFELVKGIDVLPVNRVLAAMQALNMSDIATKDDAMKLRKTLGVDGLVIGTISAYQPYDPPKLGMAIELYDQPTGPKSNGVDPRKLTEAATEGQVAPLNDAHRVSQPVDQISGYFDAADPDVREALKGYAHDRGRSAKDPSDWRLYRLSMNLYSEFVSHVMTARLIHAEQQRTTKSSARARKKTR